MGICFVYLFFTIFTVKYGADKAYFGIAILPLCQHIVQSQQKRSQDNVHDCCFKIFFKTVKPRKLLCRTAIYGCFYHYLFSKQPKILVIKSLL